MKTPLFAVLALAPVVLFAEPTPVSSQINSATVYRDRAVVTRTAKVELAAGETQLSFDKLPAGLQEESIQVTGRGTASATILDVSTRTIYVETNPDIRIKAIEDELKAVETKIKTIKARAEILEKQAELIEKVEEAATTPPTKESSANARLSVDEWQKLMAFSDENRSKLAAEAHVLEAQKEELNNKRYALQQQLNQLQKSAELKLKNVIIRLSAAKAGSLDLSISYAVTDASWAPSYDARLRAEERAVELTYFGVVRQNTGEDWKNVALTLSTAQPNLGGGAVDPHAWTLDVAVPRPHRPTPDQTGVGDANVSAMNMEAFNVAQSPSRRGFQRKREEPAESLQEAHVSVAAVDNSATSASFRIAAAATILSDNSPQKVGITAVKFPARLQYQSTPRFKETAFLSAYVINESDFPLLAGGMNTFLDDTFVAASALKAVMPGEKFELALGADEGIAFKRKLVNRFAEDTGLTSKGRRVTYEFLTTVTNNKKTPERVVFKDLLPISRNEKVVVKLIGPDPKDVGTKDKPKEVTLEQDGKMVWRIDMKPGEKREIQFKFTVEHPSDVNVSGLE